MKKLITLLTLISIVGVYTVGCGSNDENQSANKNVETNIESEKLTQNEVEETDGKLEAGEVATDQIASDETVKDEEAYDEVIINQNDVELEEEVTEDVLESQEEKEVGGEITVVIPDDQKEIKKDEANITEVEKKEEKAEEEPQVDKSEEKPSDDKKDKKREGDKKKVDKSKDVAIELSLQDNNKNQYYNDVPDLLLNSVSIDPYLIKFVDNHLVVEAFVINGFEHNVYDIDVKELTISNEDDEVIASASGFGVLQDAVIAPLSYICWRFEFHGDSILKTDDDFNSIKYYSNVSNKY